MPPGSRGERESDLEFSGFSALEEDEEEEEEEHHSVSVVEEESDGESEGDGPEVPRGGRGRVRGRGVCVGVLEVVLEVVLALLPAVVMRGGRRIPPLPLCTHTRQDLA